MPAPRPIAFRRSPRALPAILVASFLTAAGALPAAVAAVAAAPAVAAASTVAAAPAVAATPAVAAMPAGAAAPAVVAMPAGAAAPAVVAMPAGAAAPAVAAAPPAAAAPAGSAAPPAAAAPAGSAAPAVAGTEAAPVRRPDLIFVSFDTLRRDHVSAYGAERLTTPTVDALAAEGLRFTDCQAVTSVTGPSHATMFTGLYPQTHGAFRNGVPIREGVSTFAEVLAAAGHHGLAVVAGWTLRASASGLDRGFHVYDDEDMETRYKVVNVMRRADAVTDAALGHVDTYLGAVQEAGGQRPPLFLFVHYFDPHEPYASPLEEVPGPNPAAVPRRKPVRFERYLPDYDREIAFADRELGRLLAGLRERGLLADALVLFTADHGQSFGEHGEGGAQGAHGRRTYQSTLAAPLVLHWPGRIAAGRVSDVPVSHVDLVPTLAELLGLPAKAVPLGQQGDSLAAHVLDPEAPPSWGQARRIRYAVAFPGATGHRWNILRFLQNKSADRATPLRVAAVFDGKKLIAWPRRPHHFELYDLEADPGETRHLAAEEERYRNWVPRVLEWYERTRIDLQDVEHDEADMEALRALGYVD